MASRVSKRMAAAKAKKEQTAELEAEVPEEKKEIEVGEGLLKEAYQAREAEGLSAGELYLNEKARKALIEKAGFDFVDVRDLTPNPNNTYTIDEGSIESLASLIFESKNTTPLIVRIVPISEKYPHGYEIVDGERRYHAHMLLGERYGEHWYMVPARIFPMGQLSDEDATFMLHAENVGQRAMTRSERARGVAIVTDRIIARRAEDPNYAKGKKTREIIAEQFGVSDRTANIEANIGRNLGQAGMDAYDSGEISKRGADAIAHLSIGEQEELVNKVKTGELTKNELEDVAKGRKVSSTRIPKHVDEDLKEARRAMKRALLKNEKPDRVLIAELRNLLDKLDPEKYVEQL